MKVLLWDIDGTLLTTNGAGVAPFSQSLSRAMGSYVEINRRECSGLTDYQIAHKYMSGDANSKEYLETLESCIDLYADGLIAALANQPALPKPNIQELFDFLEAEDYVKLAVVTGNCERGAHAKLKSANLMRYFNYEDVFPALGLEPRYKIVERAIKTLNCDTASTFVIGDTEHDISAAKHMNIPSVIFETVDFSINQLQTFEPDSILPFNWTIDDFMSSI